MFTKNNIVLDVEGISKKSILWNISKKCANLDIIEPNQIKNLYNYFLEREMESSTGFENGIAIPHARTDSIKKSAILYIRLKNSVNWDSIDNRPTKYIIALLVPNKNITNEHMEILSSIAVGLLNKDFVNVITKDNDKNKIIEAFKNIINSKKIDQIESSSAKKNSMKILAITACPVGIAHTYLAAEKIENAAKNLNYQIKVETHGSIGIKNEFTQKEINEADIIIIASDIGIDKDRFVGKKVFESSIKEAIHNPEELIEKSLLNSTNIKDSNITQKTQKTFETEKRSLFIKHLLSGVSYMLPFIIFGGLMIALQVGLGRIIYGDSGQIPVNSPLFYIGQIGVGAFTLMIPILAAFIANSIAGRAAIAPAAIVAFISNIPALIFLMPGLDGVTPGDQTPLGFLGSIFYGFTIGYTVKWINTWKIHKNITALMPIFVIPIGVTLFFGLFAIFIINAPISFVMLKIGAAMQTLFERNEGGEISVLGQIGIGIGMGAVLGSMIGFDMGGPVNKIAFITASALLTLSTPIDEPMGMVSTAIPIAPIGMGVSSFVYKKHFTQEQRTIGASAIVMGAIGISEGAIPFAISDPKRAILANVIGSAVAGSIAGALGVVSAVPHGGPIVGILGAINGSYIGGSPGLITGLGITFFFLAIIIGTAVTVLSYGLFLKTIKYKNEVSNEVQKENRIKTSIHNLNINFNNSLLNISMKKNKKQIGFWSMTIVGLILTIVGTSLWGVFGWELTDIIRQFKADIEAGIAPPIFDSPEIIYATFSLLVGILLLVSSFMYSFTAYDKKIRQS